MLPASTAISSRGWFPRLVLYAASLAGGALAFLALAARVEGLWRLSRWPRFGVFFVGALLAGLLFGLVLHYAAVQIIRAKSGAWLVGLGAVLAIGVLLKMSIPAAAVPRLYVLEIETAGTRPGGPVSLLEVRGLSGRIVRPADFSVEGSWQRIESGFSARSDQPGRLRYVFYARDEGELQLLFDEQPAGGQVVTRLNGHDRTINLDAESAGQRLVDVPLHKSTFWDVPLRIADFAALVFVLPVFLFAAPLAALASIRWIQPRAGAELHAAVLRTGGLQNMYPRIFAAVFIMLVMTPLLGIKGDWSTINKDFFGYKVLYNVYSFTRRVVFRDVLFDEVLVGKGDWLILADRASLDDYQRVNLFTDEDLFQIQQRLDSIDTYLQSQGIRFMVMVVPNKNTIYPEYVPAGIPVIGSQSRLDQLIAYQQSHGGVQVLDLRPALLEARKQRMLFYRTDTHWNPYGAFTGYQQVMAALQKDFPNLKAHSLEDYRYGFDSNHLGDLSVAWVQSIQPEPFFELAPRFPSAINRLELLEGRRLYSFRYNDIASQDLPRAVIYHDSFMAWLSPFLTEHFSKATYIWQENIKLPLIVSEHPDIVIYEVTERYLDHLLQLPIVKPPD